MIPTAGTDLLSDFKETKLPDKTYRITGNRVGGFTEGHEAVIQAVKLILATERFIYPIYSWNYGTELSGLNGVNPPLVYSLIKQRINEALVRDDRVTKAADFTFSRAGNQITASFTVNTIYGSSTVTKEMDLYV